MKKMDVNGYFQPFPMCRFGSSYLKLPCTNGCFRSQVYSVYSVLLHQKRRETQRFWLLKVWVWKLFPPPRFLERNLEFFLERVFTPKSALICCIYYTLPETNIAPENRPLEKEIPTGNQHV